MRRPGDLIGQLLRLPIVIDRIGLGRLLGNRILIVEHVGRRSGRLHRTPLEVVVHDSRRREWVVIAAWSTRPDWLVNLEHRPAAAVRVAGHRHVAPVQRFLDEQERLDALVAYGLAHGWTFRALSRTFGWGDLRTPGAVRQLAESHVMVAFAV